MHPSPQKGVPDLCDRQIGPFSRRWIALMTHSSFMMGHFFPTWVPLTVVTGYPKSGTVWATQLIADYLQYPFHDLSFFPAGSPCVIHGHYLVKPNAPPMAYVARDGRDTMVSMFFYMAKEIPDGDNPRLPAGFGRYFSGLRNKQLIREFLPEFIKRQFSRPYGCRRNWNQHVQSFLSTKNARPDIPLLRYENLLKNPILELRQAIQTLTQNEKVDEELLAMAVRKYTFEKQTGRKLGDESRTSFVRKGQAGDWKNYFSREAAEVFDNLAGDTLIKLGYESDRNWVKNL